MSIFLIKSYSFICALQLQHPIMEQSHICIQVYSHVTPAATWSGAPTNWIEDQNWRLLIALSALNFPFAGCRASSALGAMHEPIPDFRKLLICGWLMQYFLDNQEIRPKTWSLTTYICWRIPSKHTILTTSNLSCCAWQYYNSFLQLYLSL